MESMILDRNRARERSRGRGPFCQCCCSSDRRPWLAQPESEAATARPPRTDWLSLPGPARSGLAPAVQPSADTVPPRCCRAATDHMALLATAAAVGMLLAPVTRAMHNGAAQTPPLGSVPHADRTHRPHPQSIAPAAAAAAAGCRWQNWNSFQMDFNASLIRQVATAMAANGLKDAGYTLLQAGGLGYTHCPTGNQTKG